MTAPSSRERQLRKRLGRIAVDQPHDPLFARLRVRFDRHQKGQSRVGLPRGVLDALIGRYGVRGVVSVPRAAGASRPRRSRRAVGRDRRFIPRMSAAVLPFQAAGLVSSPTTRHPGHRGSNAIASSGLVLGGDAKSCDWRREAACSGVSSRRTHSISSFDDIHCSTQGSPCSRPEKCQSPA